MKWLDFTGLQDKAHGAAGRPEPAPAQVPRAGARAGLAAAAGAARRGAVRPDAERDRRRGRADPAHPRPGLDHRLRRARDARGDGADRPHRRPQPRRAAGRRRAARRDAAARGDDRLPRGRPMLEVRDLEVAYGAAPALWGVSLRGRAPASCCASSGPNGAGKTTLINTHRRHPARARPAASCSTGRDITRAGAAPLLRGRHRDRARGPAPVHRHDACARTSSSAASCRRRKAQRARVARRGARAVPGAAGEAAPARPASCRAASSRWWRSRRALMARPRLLLLDEPSLGLSPLIVHDMFARHPPHQRRAA